MEFPAGSHVPQNNDPISDNAKEIEEQMKKIDWVYLSRVYFGCLGVILVSIFSIIFVTRLALTFF